MPQISLMSEHAHAVVLAIDPGATSGWSIHMPWDYGHEIGFKSIALTRLPSISKGLALYGQTKSTRQIQEAVAEAQEWSIYTGLCLIVVAESWKGGGGPHGNSQQVNTGLGAAWGKWQAVLDLRGQPARRVIRIDTGSWRRAIFGRTRMRSAEWKAAAQLWAQAAYGLTKLRSDEAEAICIGSIAQRWSKVHALALKPKARKR